MKLVRTRKKKWERSRNKKQALEKEAKIKRIEDKKDEVEVGKKMIKKMKMKMK